MSLRTILPVLTVLLVGLLSPLPTHAQPTVPAVFADTDLDAAVKTAADKSGYVVANFTSKTSIPSHNMDRHSWKQESVVAWINQHAVAVRIYVDEDAEAGEAYQIKDTPTHVIFHKGEEFDRTTGYLGGNELLAWFELVQTGERRLDKARALHGGRIDENGDVDVMERYKLANTYLRDKEYERATQEYLWLWKYMLDFKFSMVGVRGTAMALDIRDLIAEHPPAREDFSAIRDETEQRLKASPDWADMDDWIVLNEILGDDDKTLGWFDRVKQDPQQLAAAQKVAYRIDQTLRKHERWRDLGLIYADPLAFVSERSDWLEPDPNLTESQNYQRAKSLTPMFIDFVAQTYAGCLAADREAEAASIAEYLPAVVDPDAARLAMIGLSLEADAVRPIHLDWLDGVASEPAGLREKLKSALAGE